MKGPMLSSQADEKKIRELLDQGAWRKARDLAKPLCKVDRTRYLPLLVEANAGLARDMLAKNLVSEARQVLSYLKTIAPPAACQELEAEIGMKSGDYSAAASVALRSLEKGAASGAETQASADRLVLAFHTPDGTAGTAASVTAAAIHQALEAVCHGEYDRASELIRPIPQDSPFRTWKLFIKGLTAFHRGDSERAARLFAGLPADSVPGRAAVPYLCWTAGPDGATRLRDISGPAREHLARLAGADDAAGLIARAEALWHDGSPREMYELLRNGLESFPSEEPDWSGALTSFSTNGLFLLPPESLDQYAGYFDETVARNRTRSSRENLMLRRLLAMLCETADEHVYLMPSWEGYLRLRERLYGVHPRLTSLLYERIGVFLAGGPATESAGARLHPHRRQPALDPKGALTALRRSVEADPGNLEAHLALVSLLSRMKKNSERNRLLDVMSRRFSDNKQVLLLAGDRCVARKAYVKGLAYFERALQQDRLDPAVPEAIAVTRFLRAFEQFRRGDPDGGRHTIDAVLPLAVDHADDFVRSRWSVALRRSALELLYGDPARGRLHVEEARACAPSLEACLLFGHIAWRRYQGAPRPDPFFGEFSRSCTPQASAARAALLIRIFDFWRERRNAPPLDSAAILIREYLESAARRPFERHEAAELIERVPMSSPFFAAVDPFLRQVLKKDPKDPLFRLFDFRRHGHSFEREKSLRKKLESFMQEAVRRKDDVAVQAIRHELDTLSLPPPLPDFVPLSEEDFDLEEFASGPDFFNEIFADLERSFDAKDSREYSAFQDFLRNASEAELRRLRKCIPRDMPPEIFDRMVQAARGAGSAPERDPQAEPDRPKTRRKPPGQGRLFEP